jgi:hypothetical protein
MPREFQLKTARATVKKNSVVDVGTGYHSNDPVTSSASGQDFSGPSPYKRLQEQQDYPRSQAHRPLQDLAGRASIYIDRKSQTKKVRVRSE